MVLGVSFGVKGLVFALHNLKNEAWSYLHGSWRIFRSQRSRFCTAQLKKRGIVIFASFLAYLSESGLVFAPRKKRMFWGHTLIERGIVIFAWFQCFVWAFSYLYWVHVMPTIFTLRC